MNQKKRTEVIHPWEKISTRKKKNLTHKKPTRKNLEPRENFDPQDKRFDPRQKKFNQRDRKVIFLGKGGHLKSTIYGEPWNSVKTETK